MAVQDEAQQAIKEITQAVGEAIGEREVNELKISAPDEPDFPWLMFGAALFKDLLDGLDVTGVGAAITTIISFFFGLIIFFWLFGKINWYQKGLVRWMIRRYGIVIVLEFIPFIKIIPVWSFYVFFAYHREKKLVKLIYAALDDLKSGKVIGSIRPREEVQLKEAA